MAEAWEQNWQRLPLAGVVNARELGGFPTSSGRQTRWHRFLRSDSLVWATGGRRAVLAQLRRERRA